MTHDKQCQLEVAELLIDKGADINARDNRGWTALKCANFYKCTEIAELLRTAGATE